MDKPLTPVNDMKRPRYIRRSALEHLGLKLYTYWNLKNGYISAPADTAIHIAYILEGEGYYGNIKIQAGDVVAFGLNAQPIRFKVYGVSAFILDMDFALFYSITGLEPSSFRNSLFLDKDNPLYCMGQVLFPHPLKYWIYNIESYILRIIENHRYVLSTTMKRVVYATQEIAKEQYFPSIARDLEVSYRQLQRDFRSILGLSLKEYRSIRRFYGALIGLKNESINEVAQKIGFYDQAHMNKEFKKMSGWTPKEVSIHHY